MGIKDRLQHGWNAFQSPQQTESSDWDFGGQPLGNVMQFGGMQSGRSRFGGIANEKSIVNAIYMRMAIDFSSIAMRHVRLDGNDRFLEEVKSGVNNCLRVEANTDQAARAFRQDIALSLFDAGVIALVPIDTTINPEMSGSYDIQTMRVGTIVKWMPQHVKVSVYNETTGKRQEITVSKKTVAIIHNPFYDVMNEANSTLQRLIRKLSLLDSVDEASSSGKLDLIIQLPYVIKSEARRLQAQQRASDIEVQLRTNKHGIAYTDGTEKITQLNRPVENKLMEQITYLVELLYSQLGITAEIMNGTADEKTMLNYLNRTIEPLLDAVTEGMARTFITKTGRTQGQTMMYFRDPFKLVPIANIAEIADKFSRNKILTGNEIRSAIGYKPSDDPSADKLENSNMPNPSDAATSVVPTQEGDTP
jgi:hypothetical protein